MYTVIGYGGTRAFRVLWMLEELGLPYEHERLMPFTDAARARTPGGRVPALELAEGRMLVDSTAILTFLADRHDGLTFPAGSVERARQDAVMFRVLECLDEPLMHWTLMMHRQGDPIAGAVRDWLHRRIGSGMDSVGNVLEDGPWAMGDVFTIADIVLGHCLRWAERYEQQVRHPRLRAHLDQVERRSAYRTADAL